MITDVDWAILQAIGSQGCEMLTPQQYTAQRDSQPRRRNVLSLMALHEKGFDKAVSQVSLSWYYNRACAFPPNP